MRGQLLAAQVESVMTRRDRTIKVVLGTQELAPSTGGQLLSLMNKVVSVYICESAIPANEMEMVDGVNPEFGEKTPGYRMRAVLYLLWKQNGEWYKDLETYYRAKMEGYIDTLKQNLQP